MDRITRAADREFYDEQKQSGAFTPIAGVCATRAQAEELCNRYEGGAPQLSNGAFRGLAYKDAVAELAQERRAAPHLPPGQRAEVACLCTKRSVRRIEPITLGTWANAKSKSSTQSCGCSPQSAGLCAMRVAPPPSIGPVDDLLNERARGKI